MLQSAETRSKLDDAVAHEQRIYESSNPTSRRKFEAAKEVLPGGNTRGSLYFDPFPLFFSSARSSKVTDADGHEYSDFGNDLTAALFGHSNEAIVAALQAGLDNGVSYGGTHDHEVAFAREICRRFQSIERVRFLTSGTEANVAAIQLAKAETGRCLVLGFFGGYHGNVLNWLEPESEMNVDRADVRLARYNHIETVEQIVREEGEDIAAILVEPIMGSAGGFVADTAFLRRLRSICDEIGALLIFDEVQTARFAVGGYQSIVDISPNLTILGKFFGGGLNFGALGGAARHMDRLGPTHVRALSHGGTFSNNVLTMIAGYAALKEVLLEENVDRLNTRSNELRSALLRQANSRRVPLQLGSFGSLISTHFQADMPRGPEDVQTPPIFRKLFQLFMINNGIFITRRGQLTLSMANTEDEYLALENAFGVFLDRYGELTGAFG
ncbi:aminotransferase class III-fold pyridoxal phosphate-dependent enzyme (plasmid) [Sinorhizobium garamanticum]|uniref:Aminotransferase class III-fold pyridoxal phosphate-dependent enzyme n=1 Tax=Sinorhizobium garamanticum TaxID=680247 RepID=A0ABY8DL19_9HYPH|nr:aminotransferase class III-fold pyridoxal phosphate-dependent enzyme [Sinorhizobium garamanticum]WEX91608.1 aminotransferase class III-fold pyridoxal phosphate-dependent enzyme [Sinorhizobium garamanticum]